MRMQERECYNQAEHLGMGFDSLKEKLSTSTAIDLSKVDEEKLKSKAEQSPLEEYYSFDHIKDEKTLSKLFNISGSISGEGIVTLGSVPCVMQASVKGNYFSGIEMKENNLYILLNYQLKNTAYRMINPELSDQAKNILANSSNSTEFRQKFGDEFIVGFRTGAEYTALIEVLEIETQNSQKIYSEINTMIAPLLAIAKGNFSGDLQTSQIENLKKFTTKVFCFQKPANVSEGVQAVNLPDLIVNFINFKKNILEKGCVKSTAIFADYDQLVDVRQKILTPEFKLLKSKLNRLKSKKIEKQVQLLEIENKLKFEIQVNDLNGDLKKLINNIYEIDAFIEECLYLPDLINTEKYEGYLKL